ncbi:MAG: DUF512 domain-containing protein, partial [Clostridia bacterium]|nr:DUF512 domain-containing protein [Clostridia bacterium]
MRVVMETTEHRIDSIDKGSLAEEIGLKKDDVILLLNNEPFLDLIDYEALLSCTELTVTYRRGNKEHAVTVEKEEWETLGVNFTESLLQTRVCRNHCVFCFVDQNPKGLRKTLYVKDDDWRMSLMMGNFVTLTNVSDEELERIIRRKVSPLYISVHATNPDVRVRMMRNPQANRIMDQLHRLAEGGIQYHCQLVVCPGFNDGKILEDSIRTLASLFPAARSVALVPVGLTGHRQGLEPLTPFNAKTASAVLDMVEGYQKTYLASLGTRFVFASDEFYSIAGRPIPSFEDYEEFAQIENGVGLLRQFFQEFEDAAAYAQEEGFTSPVQARDKEVLLACGVSAAPYLEGLLSAHPVPGVHPRVFPIENRFFGPSVTVTGLLTGSDFLRELKEVRVDRIL